MPGVDELVDAFAFEDGDDVVKLDADCGELLEDRARLVGGSGEGVSVHVVAVEDGVDGLLIDPENVDALAQSITRLLDDAALRDRLSAAARTKASQWGVESITDTWEAVFLSVNK